MKTNNNIIRQMGTFSVTQRTKDGMFNATELVRQWNESTGERKEIFKFFENDNTKVFIQALMKEENLHTQNSAYVKSKASRGDNAGTWMHPILFVKFAMWLNPAFEVKVIKFVYDQMIKYRIDAGDAYKELSSAVQTIVPDAFMRAAMQKVGEAINWVCFGYHEKEARNNHGTEEEQRRLLELERKIADLIKEGFITNYDQLIGYLRLKWKESNYPKCLK